MQAASGRYTHLSNEGAFVTDTNHNDNVERIRHTMFKRLSVVLVALLLALLPVAAFAQTGVTFQTGFQVQNLGSGTATVTVNYYNADGTLAGPAQTVSIATGGSYTFFGSTMVVPAGFKGSVVISADQPVAAISNVLGTNADGAKTAGSYNGFSGGSTKVSAPIIQRGNSGYATFVAVQNAGTTAATVHVTYAPLAGSGTASTEDATIAPNASRVFDQEGNNALGVKFIGSATIESTNGQPLVATVVQLGKGSTKTQLTYDAFTAGSPSVLLPLIFANNSGFFTGLSVQNAGAAATEVTVTYTANGATGAGLCATPPASKATVAPGASLVVLNNDPTLAPSGCKYIGGATVTNSTNQPLVGIVNQLRSAGASSSGSAYEGFNPAAATKLVSAPLVQANNSGFYSAMQVQNTAATPTQITIKYSPNTATGTNVCGAVADVTDTIPASASKTYFNNAGLPTANCKYIGSATITSATNNVVAIVNQLLPNAPGDQLLTYNAFNQ